MDEEGMINFYSSKNKKFSSFIHDSRSRNHETALKNFYSANIELGLRNIENRGIKIIRNFCEVKSSNFTLNRTDLTILRFYCILNLYRTPTFRESIKKKTGDSLFNEILEKDNRSPKEIQECLLNILIKKITNYLREGEEPYFIDEALEQQKIIHNNFNN